MSISVYLDTLRVRQVQVERYASQRAGFYRLVVRPLDLLDIDTLLHHLVQRGHFAEPAHFTDHQFDNRIDFRLSIEAAEAETDAGVSQFITHAERAKHVARFEAGTRACRTTRHGHILDTHHQPLTFHICEANVRVAGKAFGWVAVEIGFRQLRHDPLAKPFAKGEGTLDFLAHFRLGQRTGRSHADDEWHRQRAGSHSAFVSAAIDLRFQPHPRVFLADVERADALRSVNLVRGHTQQVDTHLFHIERKLAYSLNGIGVEQHAPFLAEAADFFNGLNGADLVVCGHDRDENRLIRHRFANLIGVHLPVLVHRQIGDLESV